ncbi:MAG TPA: hypothetical protein VGK74_20970 [Symbiobacteriaceae bacterium]|jgi:uncharacterized membrane protein YkvI
MAREHQPGLALQTFRVAATYVGTVVGAGFASGQETLRFFAAYGRAGLIGVAVSTVLFCLFGIQIMELGRRLEAKSHREILHYACGPYLGRMMDVVITLFLGATLTVMVAGGGAVFAEQLGLSRALGTVLTSVLTGLTILAGMRGIMAANSVVVPLLSVAVFGLTAASIRFHGLDPILTRTVPWPLLAPVKSWFAASWLYVGYNLVLSISVLGPLGAEVKDRRALVGGGLAGGLVLGLLAAGIKLALSAHMPDIGKFEMPMLFLARLHPLPVQWFYTLILWAEIYTTAIASAYGFASRGAEVLRGGSYRGTVVVVTALSLLGSGIGFSRLLGFLYPLFGVVSLVVLGLLSATLLRRAT